MWLSRIQRLRFDGKSLSSPLQKHMLTIPDKSSPKRSWCECPLCRCWWPQTRRRTCFSTCVCYPCPAPKRAWRRACCQDPGFSRSVISPEYRLFSNGFQTVLSARQPMWSRTAESTILIRYRWLIWMVMWEWDGFKSVFHNDLLRLSCLLSMLC